MYGDGIMSVSVEDFLHGRLRNVQGYHRFLLVACNFSTIVTTFQETILGRFKDVRNHKITKYFSYKCLHLTARPN